MNAKTLIDRYVAQNGGQLVEELLPKSPPFENADYLFRPSDLPPVVAELKCLTEDHADLGYKEKLENLYEGWIQRGLVPDFRGRMTIDSGNLPAECQKELFEMLGSRIKKIVTKASKQIRETKAHFGLENAKGLLLLVNDGNYSLESSTILYLVGEAMNRGGSAIDTVVYFTVNMMASMPTTNRNALVWIATVHPKRQGVDPRFLTWLQEGWMTFFSKFAGTPIPVLSFDDPGVLSEAKFLRPPVPGSYYINQQGYRFRCQKFEGDTITWLALEMPSTAGPLHAVVSQNLRHIGRYRLITDASEIKRLTEIFKSLPIRRD